MVITLEVLSPRYNEVAAFCVSFLYNISFNFIVRNPKKSADFDA